MSAKNVKKTETKPETALVSQEQAEEIVKKKKTVFRKDLQNYGYENAEPGDNARYLRYAMESWDMKPIDISDPKQVEDRITDYFMHCIDNDRKPNVVGMANWLGIDRSTLYTWKVGEYRASTHSTIIKKAMTILEELWVDYMQNGKMNPASGIFLGKNMFGYKDTQDVVVTPHNPLGDYADQKQLSERIEATVIDED